MNLALSVSRRLPFLGLTLALLTAVGAAPAAEPPSPPQWPLQRQPGPDGDPRQDPATFPKSSASAQAPQRRARPSRPVLADAGDGNLVLSGGGRLQSVLKVAGTMR